MKRASVLLAVLAGTMACGGSDDGGGNGTCNPSGSTSVRISSTGVSPKATCVLPNGTVSFFNDDAGAAHVIESAGDCPAMNVGSIAPNANRSVRVADEGACEFRDAAARDNPEFRGTVFVTSAPASGPGH